MAKITVSQPHNKAQDEVRALAEQAAQELANRFQLRYQWQDDEELSFKGKGISGALRLAPGEVAVDLTTGLMLRPMTKVIRRELEKALADHLA